MADASIYVMQPDNSLVRVRRAAYDSEALLQGLLSSYPDLLAGDQINAIEPRRWLLISPELRLDIEEDGTGGWWIDHLFLDQDGIPTIVEVKRSTDTRIRREVVGQMLDYAAHVEQYWPVARIRTHFEERCKAEGGDAGDEIRTLLQDETADIDGFWKRVEDNLANGKIRLLFVADEIPLRLQRIVEFLNRYMAPTEVLAVEIKQFAGGNLRTLVPRVLGQTAAMQQKKSLIAGEKRRWDHEQFFDVLSK